MNNGLTYFPIKGRVFCYSMYILLHTGNVCGLYFRVRMVHSNSLYSRKRYWKKIFILQQIIKWYMRHQIIKDALFSQKDVTFQTLHVRCTLDLTEVDAKHWWIITMVFWITSMVVRLLDRLTNWICVLKFYKLRNKIWKLSLAVHFTFTFRWIIFHTY